MFQVLVITGFLVGALTLLAVGLLIRSAIKADKGARARARHRQLDSGRCRCGHLSLAHVAGADSDCETCSCVSFRRARFGSQTVRENALGWVQ